MDLLCVMGPVWKYDYGCFLYRNILKYFFIFLKLFLTSAYQNDLKHIKKLSFNKKKFEFF
jgi:hypothetical protein